MKFAVATDAGIYAAETHLLGMVSFSICKIVHVFSNTDKSKHHQKELYIDGATINQIKWHVKNTICGKFYNSVEDALIDNAEYLL